MYGFNEFAAQHTAASQPDMYVQDMDERHSKVKSCCVTPGAYYLHQAVLFNPAWSAYISSLTTYAPRICKQPQASVF